MLMAKLSAEARFSLAGTAQPAQALTQLNERICALNLHRFITCVIVVLEPDTHAVTIVNAGHMAPLRRSGNGQLEEHGRAEGGPPLGILNTFTYGQCELTLAPGDSLTIYTDGINEAMDAAEKCFTVERLREQILASDGSPENIGHVVLEAVRTHMAGGPQHDDMCLVVLRRR
jgi:serine phosphatase RsbU (regulator of sigma subunit)